MDVVDHLELDTWKQPGNLHAARMEISRLFPGVKLEVAKNVHSANGGRLRLEAILWGMECMSRSATTANAGMMSQNEAYYGSPPELKVHAGGARPEVPATGSGVLFPQRRVQPSILLLQGVKGVHGCDLLLA